MNELPTGAPALLSIDPAAVPVRVVGPAIEESLATTPVAPASSQPSTGAVSSTGDRESPEGTTPTLPKGAAAPGTPIAASDARLRVDTNVAAASIDPSGSEPSSTEETVPVSQEPVSQASDAFARVPEALRRTMVARGFVDLTAVQTAALDAADEARDLRITSQTGSGKTVAFGLAVAPALLSGDASGPETIARPGPSVLIIVPTRELAAQLRLELEWLYAQIPGATLDCVTGGTNLWQDRKRLARKPRVLVGTPGRLLDHISKGVLDVSGVEALVLDEADQMLDMGFRDELEAILAATPEGRRTHLVSATFPFGIRRLAERYQSHPLHVEGTRLGAANEDIDHIGHLVDDYSHYPALVNLILLNENQRTLVFVNTRAETAKLSSRLAKDGFSALPLSGELQQEQRTRTLASFRNGTATVLVATDVAARGLDVPEVAMVIHTAPLKSHEVYTHRSGRTGRAGQKGHSVLLCPYNRKYQTERLLKAANVTLEWNEIPSATVVRKKLETSERRRIWAAIDRDDSRTEDDIDVAKKLLAARDPVDVISTLLRRARGKIAHEPFDIPARAPRTSRDRGGSRAGPRERGGGASNDQRQGGPTSAPRSFDQSGKYDRFDVNFGAKAGANARRLMAILCSRGGITSRDVGAIVVGEASSQFEVAKAKSSGFEAKLREPSSRDAWLRVERANTSSGSAPSSRGASSNRVPSQAYASSKDRGGASRVSNSRGGSRAPWKPQGAKPARDGSKDAWRSKKGRSSDGRANDGQTKEAWKSRNESMSSKGSDRSCAPWKGKGASSPSTGSSSNAGQWKPREASSAKSGDRQNAPWKAKDGKSESSSKSDRPRSHRKASSGAGSTQSTHSPPWKPKPKRKKHRKGPPRPPATSSD